jgi:ssDNA-binding Zn-finger/Zn-ribbon topoisomerase 1
MDVTGWIGDPEKENTPCDDFIDAERVKIQDKANWLETVHKYSSGDVHVCHYCTKCGELRKVKSYDKAEWENYYSEHYRDGVKLPSFCENCGSVMEGIMKPSGD